MRLPLLVLFLLAPAFAQWTDLSGQFLGLTSDQSRRIAQNQDAHYEWMKPQQARVELVRAEIVEESLRVPLDPLALGLRYAELEAIRREDLERRDQLVRLNRSVLTEAQNKRATTLAEVENLAVTARHADCGFLIYENNPRACGLLYIELNSPIPPLVLPGITILDPRTFNDPTKPLREFLALTPEQSAVYLRNLSDFQSRERQLRNSSGCAEVEAFKALSASPLAPAAIGAAKADVINARRASEELRKTAVATNQALLTPAQRERLNVLDEARQLAGTANLAASNSMLFTALSPVAPFAFFFSGELGPSCSFTIPVQGRP